MTNIEIIDPNGFYATMEIDNGGTIVAHDDTDDESETTNYSIGIEDLSSGRQPECPCCLTELDRDEWDDLGGYGCRSGGKTTYGCPMDDCRGTIEVYV